MCVILTSKFYVYFECTGFIQRQLGLQLNVNIPVSRGYFKLTF